MRSFVAAMLVAILAVSSFAADAIADKKSKRTLKEEIELALAQGKDDTIRAPMAEKFGLGRADFSAKKLRYKQFSTPDKKEHSFVVVLKPGEQKPTPMALELSYGTGQLVDGKAVVDTTYFLSSPDGKLEKAFHNQGIVGKIVPVELPIKSSDVKKQFHDELEFHERQTVELGLEPAK